MTVFSILDVINVNAKKLTGVKIVRLQVLIMCGFKIKWYQKWVLSKLCVFNSACCQILVLLKLGAFFVIFLKGSAFYIPSLVSVVRVAS